MVLAIMFVSIIVMTRKLTLNTIFCFNYQGEIILSFNFNAYAFLFESKMCLINMYLKQTFYNIGRNKYFKLLLSLFNCYYLLTLWITELESSSPQ